MECNKVLTLAAAFGVEFAFSQLDAAMAEYSRYQILEALDEAISANMIEEIENSPGTYRFSHRLTQETIIGELSATALAQMHADIGTALETFYEGQISKHAAELAYYYKNALPLLDAGKLIHYSELAGGQALLSYAYEDAAGFFLDGLAALGDAEEDTSTKARLLRGLGRAYAATDVEKAWNLLRQAFELYCKVGNTIDAMKIATLAYEPMGFGAFWYQSKDMLWILERAAKLVKKNTIDEGRILCRLAYHRYWSGEGKELYGEVFSRALEIAVENRDKRLEMRIYAYWGRAGTIDSDTSATIGRFRRSLDLASDYEDPHLGVFCHFGLAQVLKHGSYDLESATSSVSEGLQIAERLRDPYWMHIGHYLLAGLALVKGDAKTAKDEYRRCREYRGDLKESPTLIDIDIRLKCIMGDFAHTEEELGVLLDPKVCEGTEASRLSIFANLAAGIAVYSGSRRLLEDAEPMAKRLLQYEGQEERAIANRAAECLAWIAILKEDREDEKIPNLLEKLDHRYNRDFNILGLLANLLGHYQKADGYFNEALATFRKGFRPDFAWTCYYYAGCLLHRGRAVDRAKARSLLDEGLETSRSTGIATQEKLILDMIEQYFPITDFGQNPDGLTAREIQVLRLIMKGFSDKEIGEMLFISRKTVSNHVSNILEKSGTANRAEAAAYAERNGIS